MPINATTVNRDEALANNVRRRDDLMDDLRDQILRELLTYLHVGSRPETIDQGIHLILVPRHLERMGDHSSNISENVVYMIRGRIVRHQQEALRRGNAEAM